MAKKTVRVDLLSSFGSDLSRHSNGFKTGWALGYQRGLEKAVDILRKEGGTIGTPDEAISYIEGIISAEIEEAATMDSILFLVVKEPEEAKKEEPTGGR